MGDAKGRQTFFEELREQRWDDHRYYHQSRINQTLHFFSALSFLTAYVMIWIDPVIACLLGWLVAMTLRQSGHFFFEPKTYDLINDATHEHKENIKVGYNLSRKVVLISIFVLLPLILVGEPSLFGLFAPHANGSDFLHNTCVMWIGLGALAIVFRTVQLFFVRGVQSGLVWATKILTDPFHDVKLYHRAPLYLLRGELLDPMDEDWSGKPTAAS